MELKKDKTFHRPAKPKASSILSATVLGIASLIFAIFGLFAMATIFVPLAAVCAGIAISKDEKILGGFGLFCALIAFVASPTLTAMVGMPNILGRFRSGAVDMSDPYPSLDGQFDYMAKKQHAGQEMIAANAACQNARLVGTLKTYSDAASCSAPKIIEAYKGINYPYMDLIEGLVKEHAELAARLDKNQITEEQAADEDTEYVANLTQEARARDAAR